VNAASVATRNSLVAQCQWPVRDDWHWQAQVMRVITQRRVFEILEIVWVDDRQSLYCDLFLSALIIVNMIAICLETIDSLFAAYKTVFVVVELVSVSIFAVDAFVEIFALFLGIGGFVFRRAA
jgi:hypothetical protein